MLPDCVGFFSSLVELNSLFKMLFLNFLTADAVHAHVNQCMHLCAWQRVGEAKPLGFLPWWHVSLHRVVSISHFYQRAFEWEQWLLLPWTLFLWSKDKREAWKEETRSAPSKTKQLLHRTFDSHVSPLSAHFRQERLASLRDGESGGSVLALQ